MSNYLIILKCVYADAFITCQNTNGGGCLQIDHASLSVIKYGRKNATKCHENFFHNYHSHSGDLCIDAKDIFFPYTLAFTSATPAFAHNVTVLLHSKGHLLIERKKTKHD